jgi:hypothetical protein
VISGFINSNLPTRYVCKMEQIYGMGSSQHIGMKTQDLTKIQLSSVRCPTCGVTVGRRCELNTGQPRFEAHMDRKLSACDLVERKRRQRKKAR